MYTLKDWSNLCFTEQRNKELNFIKRKQLSPFSVNTNTPLLEKHRTKSLNMWPFHLELTSHLVLCPEY